MATNLAGQVVASVTEWAKDLARRRAERLSGEALNGWYDEAFDITYDSDELPATTE